MTDRQTSGESASDPPLRLVLADDHAIVLDGLLALLQGEPTIQIVGTAATGTAALETIRKSKPDIALLDISMPGMTGIEVTRSISKELPETRVLILTMHDDEAFFFEALHAGASGYLLKGAGKDELLTAIFAVSADGAYIPPQLAKGLVREALGHQPTALDNPPGELTERESEILGLICDGLTNKEIADRLVLSLNTVKSHRLRLYQKLQLHTRAELVAFAQRRGLLH